MAFELPWFPFYAKDFITSENVIAMNLASRGAYVTLLAHQRIEGSIPSEIKRIAAILRTTIECAEELWPEIQPCFVAMEGTKKRLVNPKLHDIREESISSSVSRSEAGKTAAKCRWQRNGRAVHS